MGFNTMTPTSNDPPRKKEADESPWLGTNYFVDRTALVLNNLVGLCLECERETHVDFLDANKLCPDCR